MTRKNYSSRSNGKIRKIKQRRKSRKISEADLEDVMRARRIVSHIMKRLEKGLSSTEFTTKKEDKFLWGEKDSAITVLSKLTKMLLDLIPAGNEIDLEEPEEITEEQITTEDIEILQRLLKRYADKGRLLK